MICDLMQKMLYISVPLRSQQLVGLGYSIKCEREKKTHIIALTCHALFEGRVSALDSAQSISLTHLCTSVWRKLLHTELVRLVTSHRIQKSCSVDAPLCMAICNHVACVTPLNGLKEPKLKKFSDPTHMT